MLEDFDSEEYRRLAVLRDWPSPSLVEREMLLYDTLHALSTYSPRKLTFKGGTMISRVYLHEPTLLMEPRPREQRTPLARGCPRHVQKTNRRMVGEGATVQQENSLSIMGTIFVIVIFHD